MEGFLKREGEDEKRPVFAFLAEPGLEFSDWESVALGRKRYRELLGSAKYVSTALTADGLADLYGEWQPSDDQILFLFENTFDPFIPKKQGLVSTKSNIVPVVIDRLALHESGPHWISGDTARLDLVLVEPRWAIWSASSLLGEIAPENCIVPGEEGIVYWYRRKRYMVNALHTAIAFLGYGYLRELGYRNKRNSSHAFPLVVETTLASPRNRRLLDVLVRAQATRLLIETRMEKASIPQDNGDRTFESLVETGNEAIQRFRKFPDELSRVLRQDDAKKRLDRLSEQIVSLGDFVNSPENQEEWWKATQSPGRPALPEVRAVVDDLRSVAMSII
jgi:hypothetical protein